MSVSLSNNRNHALVIGGSMAGLLAARILLNHFERVTLVERDRFPPQPQQRNGVPQGSHVHILLIRGQQILTDLFPSLERELIASQVPQINFTVDWLTYSIEGWHPRFPSDLDFYACSRNLLEWKIRNLLTANKKLELRENCQVKNIIASSDKSQIIGVELYHQDSKKTEQIKTDFIVDASGRNSKTPQWLTALGYQPPEEKIVNSFLGYASRSYQKPDGFEADWKGLLIETEPPSMTRGGVLYPVEGDRWIVTLVGVGKDYPPTDEQGFLDFACSLRHPILSEAIANAQPISPISSYRRTENRLLHYEKLSKLPEGLVTIGDAVCAFNPVYGQGMTTAALEALTLDKCLQKRENSSQFAHDFYQQLHQVIRSPWTLATGEDFRWKTTVGGQASLSTLILQKYMDQLMKITNENHDLYYTWLKVLHMLEQPTALFHPKFIFKVLQQVTRERFSTVDTNPRKMPTIAS
ncbi:MAG: 2-polyprenyl-6-methoxyphenol hydroxylase-like oxidoreductase [Lyngbya sp.]|nr:2-polyprenyl-6-methoxyphenol hydroxylase-like oxidoreductase [Lyngbya sp.]